MALTKQEIEILRCIQKSPSGITPGDFIRTHATYSKANLITARLAMKRLVLQGWLVDHQVDPRIKSYALSPIAAKVDFNKIEAVG